MTIEKLRFWWSDKYKLPPNDDRFTSSTQHLVLVDYVRDQLLQKEELGARLRQTGIDAALRAQLQSQIRAIDRALGNKAPTSTDKWDAALDRGEVPEDLLELSVEALEKLKKARTRGQRLV